MSPVPMEPPEYGREEYIKNVEAQLSAAQAEIERLRQDLFACQKANGEVATLNIEQIDTIERFRQIIRDYGGHTLNCNTERWSENAEPVACNCGWDKVVDALAKGG